MQNPSVHCQETLVDFEMSLFFTMHSLAEGEKGTHFLLHSEKRLIWQTRQTLVWGLDANLLSPWTSDSPVTLADEVRSQ